MSRRWSLIVVAREDATTIWACIGHWSFAIGRWSLTIRVKNGLGRGWLRRLSGVFEYGVPRTEDAGVSTGHSRKIFVLKLTCKQGTLMELDDRWPKEIGRPPVPWRGKARFKWTSGCQQHDQKMQNAKFGQEKGGPCGGECSCPSARLGSQTEFGNQGQMQNSDTFWFCLDTSALRKIRLTKNDSCCNR